MILDFAWDAVKMLAGAGVVGWVASLAVMLLKHTSVVKKLKLEELLDTAASRIVAYVQDAARETGATGSEQRDQAVKALTEQTGIDQQQAEEHVRAAYQKMKNGG